MVAHGTLFTVEYFRNSVQVEVGERMALQVFAATESNSRITKGARTKIDGWTGGWVREDARVSKAEKEFDRISTLAKYKCDGTHHTVSQVRTPNSSDDQLRSVFPSWISALFLCPLSGRTHDVALSQGILQYPSLAISLFVTSRCSCAEMAPVRQPVPFGYCWLTYAAFSVFSEWACEVRLV